MKIKRIFIKHSDVLLVASTFLFFYIKNNPLNKIEPSWLGGGINLNLFKVVMLS